MTARALVCLLLSAASAVSVDTRSLDEASLLTAESEPEQKDQLIALRLAQILGEMQDSALPQTEAVIQDLKRHGLLTEDAEKALRLASKALVVKQSDAQRKQQVSNMKSAVALLPLERMKTALKGMGADRSIRDITSESDWEKALTHVLTAEQSASWKQLKQERATYRDKAIIKTLVLEYTMQLELTAEQRDQVVATILSAMQDWLPDIRANLGGDEEHYAQSLLVLLPLLGKQIETHFTPEQKQIWKTLFDAELLEAARHLSRYHEQRLKNRGPVKP